jgi:hypothetical protein
MEILLNLVLAALLGATLFQAVRLERALRVLKADRGVLDDLAAGLGASTAQTEAAIERLQNAAEGAGRQLARQVDAGTTLRDDLTLLIERCNRIADRPLQPQRAVRPAAQAPAPRQGQAEPAPPRARSQAEMDLIKALRMAR